MSGNSSQISVIPPPSGTQSNFVDPPTEISSVVAGTAVVLSILTPLVALRVFTRLYVVREFKTEDYFAVLAWAGIVIYAGAFVYIENYGFARHLWDVSLPMYSKMLYWLNVIYALYAWSVLAAKLSVFYQIKRIFTTPHRDAVYWVVQISIGLNVVFYVALFFAYVFQCWPREAIWDFSVQGTCISSPSVDLAAGILNLISDIEALVLPGWVIWHLHLPIKKKLSAFIVFAIGLLAVAIGVAGLAYRIILLSSPDFTWMLTQVAMLVLAEMAAVTVVGCVPALPRFWQFLKPGNNSRSGYARASADRKSFFQRTPHTGDESGVPSHASDAKHQFRRFGSEDDVEMQRFGMGVHTDVARIATDPDRENEGIWKTVRVNQTVEKVGP